MAPSSWHGATTVVMGNCGVGFAPVRKGSEDFLIELMEAVEDIPGTALHEGIDWQWESFGEYLDALDTMPRTVDVAAQVPHVALRAYVLGDRAHDEDVTADEYAEMARLTGDALRAGALGFSTSRTILHKSRHGLIPGTHSVPDELLAIGHGMVDAGGGVFQFVSDNLASSEEERGWMRELAELGPHDHVLARPVAPGPPGVRHGARRGGRADRRRRRGLPAGAGPPDRDALRAADLAAPVHRLPQLPAAVERAAGGAGRRAARPRAPGPPASTRSSAPATGPPPSSPATGPASTASATRPTTSPDPRRRSPRPPSARAVDPRRWPSTGCSRTTARRSCSPRSAPTSTRTTRRSGR